MNLLIHPLIYYLALSAKGLVLSIAFSEILATILVFKKSS